MDFVFGENTTVADINKVPEQFRGLYAQGDSGYTLKDDYKGVVGAVDGLNKSLKASRREADEFRKNRVDTGAYAAVGQLFGLEGDEASSAEAIRVAAEKTISESKDGKVNWEKMKGSLEQGYKKQLEGKDGELSAMGKTLQKYLVTTAAVQAIASNKGVPELLLPHIQGQTKVIKEGEDYVVRVVDQAGDPRGNASGGFMTVEDLVKEMKASTVFGRAFESEAKGGSGTPPGSQQRQQQQGRELSATEKIAQGLAKRQQRG
jgi:hypothetical protein